jgi:3-dehydroquinate synthase
MTTLNVELGDRSYPIHIGSGLLATVADVVLERTPVTSVALLTHRHLERLYAAPVLEGLRRRGVRAETITIPAGEGRKNLATVARLYEKMVAARLDRRSVLVTLGGGVLGDMGGFAAATYMRGIPFVQVPTTLLAQVDASVGGKTGVDLPSGKNLVGAFHQPAAVIIDLDTLTTLPRRELRGGLAEVIKYGIIRDKRFFDLVETTTARILRLEHDPLAAVIHRSCEIKAEVVAADETEQGLRAILNFGHSIGHALEAVTGYRRYKHGEAIAIGMLSACLIGEETGVTPRAVTERLSSALAAAGLPRAFPSDVSPESIREAALRDKKTIGGRLRFVLASDIGCVEIGQDVPFEVAEAALSRQRELSD